ncbi:MAG: DUF3135 domain-containing protein [Gammaproteobacteria bacterium]|nr:DUF3135 domain-containing protein [Gammaproteobacteria bacterium]
MARLVSQPFDFERWAYLARTDPQAFETERVAAVDAIIRRAPRERQPRLRGLQWQIDQVRRCTHNPVVACERIQRMMWDAVLRDGGLLETLRSLGDFAAGSAPRTTAPRRVATVLPFPRRDQA